MGSADTNPEAVARQFITKRLPAEALETLQLYEPIPWKRGVVVLYDVILPAYPPMPAQAVAGYVIIERNVGPWSVTGSLSKTVNKTRVGREGTSTAHVVENGYALLFGHVPTTVSLIEATFDTGEVQQAQPVNQLYIVMAADAGGLCDAHVTTNDGAVEELAFGPPHAFSSSVKARPPAPQCR